MDTLFIDTQVPLVIPAGVMPPAASLHPALPASAPQIQHPQHAFLPQRSTISCAITLLGWHMES